MTVTPETPGPVQLVYDAGEHCALAVPRRMWHDQSRIWYAVAECLLGSAVTARTRATWEHTIIHRKRRADA